MNVTDEPVSAEIMGNIEACANHALKVLGADFADADPARVVEAIDDFAFRWQEGDRPASNIVEDGEDARLIFGSLWGHQLVKQFGWQWAKITFHDDKDSVAFGVVSPDRSLAIYPLDFMRACFEDPEVDVTVMLSFNMLAEGRMAKLEPKSYTNVMAAIYRIIPRR